ncbi:BtpA/SgcQ family protein [Myxococcota bacterium]|nr:BtpA/SgcQ family protein [Myxococcota bacterium]
MNFRLMAHAARPALIGMIHLDALPGAPAYSGDLDLVVSRAVADALVLAEAGFDALMVENFHDTPFFKTDLPPETVAALTRCALEVRRAVPALPLGINALRNDGVAALAIAVATGAAFIRVNVLTGAMVTDQGLVEGCAADLLRRRAALGSRVAVLADVLVKHAAPLGALDLTQSAQDMVHRGGAQALVVSGTGTGAPTDPDRVRTLRRAVPETPVVIGSGTTAENLRTLAADAYIVGTSLKVAGRVDLDRARAVVAARG